MEKPVTIGIVGGGIAGLCAALEAREHGADVTLFEAMQHLGGRAGGGKTWETGRHLATSAYTDFLWLLDQLGTRQHLVMKPLALGVLLEKGRPFWHFQHPTLGPLATVTSLLGSDLLPFGTRTESLFSMLRAVKLAAPEPDDDDLAGDATQPFVTIPEGNIQELFETTRWPKEFQRRIGRPLARSIFNLSHLDTASAPFLVVLKRTMSANPKEAGWSIGNPGALLSDAAPGKLKEKGVQVYLRTLVSEIIPRDGKWFVKAGETEQAFDRIILTAPFNRLGMLATCEPLQHLTDATAMGKVEGGTIVTCRARYNHLDVEPGPMAELSDEDPAWFAESHPEGGVQLERIVSGLDSSVTVDREAMKREFLDLTRKYFTSDDPVGDVEIRPYIHATPSLKPGLRRPRLLQAEGFYYASDWSATGLPATMESAARAGRVAGRHAAKQ